MKDAVGRKELFSTLGAFGAAAASRSTAWAADSYVLRLSSPGPVSTAWNTMAVRLAVAVDRRSQGRLKIEVYPNAQLMKEQETISGLQSGVIDLALQNTAIFEPLFPHLQVFDLPFMFKDAAAAYRVVDGPIGTELFNEFAARGLVGFSWGGSGFKELETANRAVRTPDDMKGMRFRIQGGAVNVAMCQALGAIPVTIDFAEVFTALSQHTIDAVDPNLEGFLGAKLDTVVKYVAITNHIFSLLPLVGSKNKIDSLPPDLQKILRDEAKAAAPGWRALSAQKITEAAQTLKSRGIVFTEIDYPAFRKAMEPVYTSVQSKIGADFLQRVNRATAV